MAALEPSWLRDRLVDWFADNARDLPWRRDPTPYRVLMSELMLQQTRVDTVVPFFERFTARWPTVHDLASATDDDVLQAWAGLGYYRRARALLSACRQAAALGGIPNTLDGLRDLPGVGPYTAGAIASIAYGLPVAAVDGNVERVISRVYALADNPRKAAGKRLFHAKAEAISAPGVASEVTQGLMELGATVCTPKNPTCDRCPWKTRCAAFAEGQPTAYPNLPARKPPVPVAAVTGALWRGDRLCLVKRPAGLLGGMWEMVSSPLTGTVSGREAVAQAFRSTLGMEVVVEELLGKVQHIFTHRKLSLEVWQVSAPDAAPLRLVAAGDEGTAYVDLALVDPHAPGVALSKLTQKSLAVVRAAQGESVVAPVAAQGALFGGAPHEAT